MITAQNVYDFTIYNCSFTNIVAQNFKDAVILSSMNGMNDLEVRQINVSRMTYVMKPFFDLNEISYSYYSYLRNPLKLAHTFTLKDAQISDLTIKAYLDNA